MAFLSKESPSSLIHFSILLWYASMHCWKDSCMPHRCVDTALLMASTPSKSITLMILSSRGKEKKSHRATQGKSEVVPVRRGFSRPGTSGCLGCGKQMHFRGDEAAIFLPRKHMKKELQCLQKAKITVIYAQYIMLDDNRIHQSLFGPYLTQHTQSGFSSDRNRIFAPNFNCNFLAIHFLHDAVL